MSYSYERQIIDGVVSTLKGHGFRVFIAERGTYGFYTDQSASRVVSFQCSLGIVSFSGNYNSRSCGSGWRITDDIVSPTKEEAQMMLDSNAPYWATKGEQVSLVTLDDHLKKYQQSSRYKEV